MQLCEVPRSLMQQGRQGESCVLVWQDYGNAVTSLVLGKSRLSFHLSSLSYTYGTFCVFRELEEDFLDPLQYYLGYRAKWNQTEFDYHENMAVVHVFGRLILRQLQTSLARWVHRPTVRSVCETFNALVEDLCTKLRQIQVQSSFHSQPSEAISFL